MSAGGSAGSSDTRFDRNGSVNTSSWRDLTDKHHGLFDQGFKAIGDVGLGTKIAPNLEKRMNRGWGDVPYNEAICQVIKKTMPDNSVPGQRSLQGQAAIDPYSGEYDRNTFAKYSDEVLRSLGQARGGPSATRGGTAAQGYMMGDVASQLGLNRQQNLSQQRGADAQIQQGASQALGNERAQMNDTAVKAAGTGFGGFFNLLQDQHGAEQLSTDRTKGFNELVPAFTTLDTKMLGNELNALTGRGMQSSSSYGMGVNLCCFIFLEAHNGMLPESVRRYRDMAAPECSARRAGYIRMSRWLVPLMRVSTLARKCVNALMVKPLTQYGEWFYGKNKTGWVFWPVKQTWFGIWSLTGKK